VKNEGEVTEKFEIRNPKFETNPKFEFRIFVCALALFLGLDAAFTQSRRFEQAPPLSPAEGAREAKVLVSEMLSARPEQNSTNVGVLKIRDPEGNQRQIPLKIVTLITPADWRQIYQSSATPVSPAVTLTIVHTSANTNQYFLSTAANSAAKLLTPTELMTPFAGSDFWIADLGYEFLHWPKQTVIKSDMRHSRACKVLESINPNPSSGGYTRVVCWITVEKPHAPVHADAYDASGRFKQFDPKNLEKVNGVYQIESVEMRNSKTGSHTILEFDTQ
jgi:hypothetical protein